IVNRRPPRAANLELLLPGPDQGVAGWQLQRLRDRALGLVDVPADVARGGVDVHISGELTVFVANHRRSRRQRDRGELPKWNLRTRWRFHQHAFELGKTVTESARVPDVHRISLAPLDRARDVLPADCRFDYVLDVTDRQSVSGDCLAIDAAVGDIALRARFREHTPRASA